MIAGRGYFTPFYDSLSSLAREAARAALNALIATLGRATDPDFSAVTRIYQGMLAISLLILGAVVALALAEEILGGERGAGFEVVPRALLAGAVATLGLPASAYAVHALGLLAEAWVPQLNALAAATAPASGPAAADPVSQLAVSAAAALMVLVLQVELALRSALLLLATCFIPFTACLWVWPRLSAPLGRLMGFAAALIVSKFVIATALVVGLQLVLRSRPSERWAAGLAVLVLAAFSPALLTLGLGLGEAHAARAARHGLGQLPWRHLFHRAGAKVARRALPAYRRATGVIRGDADLQREAGGREPEPPTRPRSG